jgi:hypothetical protein
LSWPGLTGPSTRTPQYPSKALNQNDYMYGCPTMKLGSVDGRHKAGHDVGGQAYQ